MRKYRTFVLAGLGVVAWLAMAAVPAYADLTTFPNPTADYTGSTCLISGWHSVADFTDLSSVSGCGVTVSFSIPLEARSVPGTWATWSSPPFSETMFPRVLWSQGGLSVTMSISGGAIDTYGFEAEPNPFAVHSMTAAYFSPAPHGAITRSVDGTAGARLFAGRTSDSTFTSVTFSSDADWAIARIRVRLISQVPEPSIALLLGTGLLAILGAARKRVVLA